jgi:hypothetical protein
MMMMMMVMMMLIALVQMFLLFTQIYAAVFLSSVNRIYKILSFFLSFLKRYLRYPQRLQETES